MTKLGLCSAAALSAILLFASAHRGDPRGDPHDVHHGAPNDARRGVLPTAVRTVPTEMALPTKDGDDGGDVPTMAVAHLATISDSTQMSDIQILPKTVRYMACQTHSVVSLPPRSFLDRSFTSLRQ